MKYGPWSISPNSQKNSNRLEQRTKVYRYITVLLLAACLVPASRASGQVNLVVSDHSGHNSKPLCGLYSLLGAAESLQVEVDHNTLLDNKFVSGEQGSSVLDLCRAAKAIDLIGKPWKGMTANSLKSSRHPLLLHLNRDGHRTTRWHWVLYLGDEEGKAVIFDTPDAIATRKYADLLAQWDGVAIEITKPGNVQSDEPAGLPGPRVLLIGLALGLTMWIKELAKGRHPVLAPWMTSLVLVFVVALFANGFHWLSPAGMHVNPSAVALVCSHHTTLGLPEVSTGELATLIHQDADIAIVDARSCQAYVAGHVPGSISLPVDSTPEQLGLAVDSLADADAVIVYCQSHGCSWDETIARHLVYAGIRNVMLYSDGWQKWQEQYSLEY